MTSSLTGWTVAVAEGRQLDELVELLAKEGAVPLRCPLISIVDNPDVRHVISWIEDLVAGRFSLVIFMTGEAVRRINSVAEKAGLQSTMMASLRSVSTLTRGPKPVRALKDLGVSPTLVAEKPTTDGVIGTLRSVNLVGATVGLTLYGESNHRLEQFLTDAGASVKTVMSYIFAPASDTSKVVELINAMDQSRVDCIVFTSSPQVERLFEVARGAGTEAALHSGLAKTLVAVVGPVVARTLAEHNVSVDVCPEHGFVMKNLVAQLRRAASDDKRPRSAP